MRFEMHLLRKIACFAFAQSCVKSKRAEKASLMLSDSSKNFYTPLRAKNLSM
jgi:hypothetical protein